MNENRVFVVNALESQLKRSTTASQWKLRVASGREPIGKTQKRRFPFPRETPKASFKVPRRFWEDLTRLQPVGASRSVRLKKAGGLWADSASFTPLFEEASVEQVGATGPPLVLQAEE